MVMLSDLEGCKMGTLQGRRLEGVNTDIFPIISKLFGLSPAVSLCKGINLFGHAIIQVAQAL
jgi:hypothetical protein